MTHENLQSLKIFISNPRSFITAIIQVTLARASDTILTLTGDPYGGAAALEHELPSAPGLAVAAKLVGGEELLNLVTGHLPCGT